MEEYKKIPSVQNHVLDLSLDQHEASSNINESLLKNKKIQKILLAVGLVILIVFIFKSKKFHELYNRFITYMHHLYKASPKKSVFIFIFFLIIVQTSCIFSHSTLCFVINIVINNFMLGWIVCLIGSVLGSAFVYFLYHRCLEKMLKESLQKYEVYQILEKESISKPYKTAFIVRFLFIPSGIKDYILAAMDNPFEPFMISVLTSHLFYSFEAGIWAKQIQELSNMNEEDRGWSNKTFLEKCIFVFILVFGVLTILFAFYLGNWLKEEMERRQKERGEITELKILKRSTEIIQKEENSKNDKNQ